MSFKFSLKGTNRPDLITRLLTDFSDLFLLQFLRLIFTYFGSHPNECAPFFIREDQILLRMFWILLISVILDLFLLLEFSFGLNSSESGDYFLKDNFWLSFMILELLIEWLIVWSFCLVLYGMNPILLDYLESQFWILDFERVVSQR